MRQWAPEVARASGLRSLTNQLTGSAIATVRQRLGDLWDASIEEALFAQLNRTDLSTEQVLAILETLSGAGHEDALAWASTQVSVSTLCDERTRELALRIAELLARKSPLTMWRLIEEISNASDEAGRALLGRLADEARPGVRSDLTPDELGRLFTLLQRLYPRTEESPAERSGYVTPAMRVSLWRGQILEQLVLVGTPEAVAVIAQLEEQFDEFGWIRRMRHRAHEQLRRAAWSPPDPADVVQMGSSDRRRYVPDPVALRAVVLDALAAIARDMRGAFPLAPALWNTAPYRSPKSENEISNQIAGWLRERIGERRAIVNREVEVNAFKAAGGDRTDLLVQATSSTGAPLSVILEVKGAWNKDVITSMSDQLVTKYLKPDLTNQGIYLVFWFARTGWDDYDANERRRRARATRSNVANLSAMLAAQAREVSRDHGVLVASFVIDASMP